jgi:hypothetical protein
MINTCYLQRHLSSKIQFALNNKMYVTQNIALFFSLYHNCVN